MRGALIFDFDGLVVDTESTDFEAWRSVYADHGQTLPLDRWQSSIGTDGRSFEPFRHLREITGQPLVESEVRTLRRARHDRLAAHLRPLPGVVDWIEASRRHGLALAIASSSPHSWVTEHLGRIGLLSAFDLLMTSDHVERVKPDPALYRQALEALGVAPARALALEDSPHGVTAAKAAGLYCVAVPGPMTRNLSFHAADLVLDSLAAASLDEILRRSGLELKPHGDTVLRGKPARDLLP
jgi:HAD superfamily hydrolase (TIGR01509 family)